LFEKALLLYESGTVEQQIRTRYRLGKLYVALNDFDAALAQFRIVEASGNPPIVGWVLLGRAYLEQHDYAEAEYYFKRVIECGALLDSDNALARLNSGGIDPVVHSNDWPDRIVGTRVDEHREWRLALVRAWGYLGVALSYAERDGDLDTAKLLVASARELARSPHEADADYQTRVMAACDDCEGYIMFKQRAYDDAAAKLELAVHQNPFSRSYLNLARTYVRLGDIYVADHQAYAEQAKRCVEHARSLAPTHEATPEMSEILGEIARLQD
jgi:tetratricopeptide (TPR) repeat protein